MATTRASNQFQGLQTKARYLRASDRKKPKCKSAGQSARGKKGRRDGKKDKGTGRGRGRGKGKGEGDGEGRKK